MKEQKFDKTTYSEKPFKEADNSLTYWRSRPMWERLQAGYHLSLRAYAFAKASAYANGHDPNGPEQKIDRTIFSTRKHAL